MFISHLFNSPRWFWSVERDCSTVIKRPRLMATRPYSACSFKVHLGDCHKLAGRGKGQGRTHIKPIFMIQDIIFFHVTLAQILSYGHT